MDDGSNEWCDCIDKCINCPFGNPRIMEYYLDFLDIYSIIHNHWIESLIIYIYHTHDVVESDASNLIVNAKSKLWIVMVVLESTNFRNPNLAYK